jgi:phytoene synthase
VADLIDDVPQLQRIVNAYAPKKIREGQQIVWALDARMAEIIRSTSEPMIGQMRLTWWHEALTKDPKAGGSGEPLMDALRRQVLPLSGGESLLSIIDGWEVLLQPLPLSDSQLVAFAEQRGGGLFRVMSALAGGGPPWLAQAGMGWALWDLSGHVSDQDTARRALHLAAEFLADVPKRDWRAAFASLRILTALARSDAERGDIPPFRLTIRQYARIVGLGFWGG